jgi:ABC-type sulfate/molybdate transport systems ATPase subunit
VLEADVEVDRREFTLRAAISVRQGERLALFGPSGAGKTTLLEAIAGLVPLRQGTISLAGRALTSTSRPAVTVPAWQRQVGLLRQDPGLFPHMTVGSNLTYSKSGTAAELADVADALGIAGLLGAMPATLSGGQQQRVALGRLLLAHCRALLLDEPFTGLDAALRRALTALVARLVTERELPAVLVTHELADAQAFADQLAILDRGQVLQAGAPDEVVLRPASRRVAELVGYLGFVPVAGGRAGAGSGADAALAGIHPDRVVAGAAADRGLVLRGMIRGSRPAGAGWELDVDVDGSIITCRLLDQPQTDGGAMTVTALDPPLFGPDGTAVACAARPGGELRAGEPRAGELRAG